MPPRKKKTTTTVEEIVPEHVIDAEEAGPTELDYNLEDVQSTEKLQEIVEQFPHAGITVKLYDEEGAFCMGIPDPTNIDEEVIRKRCGAGNFKLRIYVGGKYRQAIPLPIRQLLLDEDHQRNGDHSVSPHSDFFVQLEKQAQRNHELLLAAVGASRTTGPTITELVTALAGVDNLRGKQESTLDMVLKGIELAKSMNGESDWKSDAIRMAKDVLPKISDGLVAVMGNRNGQTNLPTNQTSQEVQTQENFPPAEAIKAGIAYLKKKCISGVQPDLIIEWVATNAEDYRGLITVILNKEFAEFAAYDMEIGSEPFLGWFKQLFDGLRSAFSSTDSVDDDTGRDLGDTDNPGNDGKSSEGRKSKSQGTKTSE